MNRRDIVSMIIEGGVILGLMKIRTLPRKLENACLRA